MSVVRSVAGILLMLTFVSVPAIGQEQLSYEEILWGLDREELEQLTEDQKKHLSRSDIIQYLLKRNSVTAHNWETPRQPTENQKKGPSHSSANDIPMNAGTGFGAIFSFSSIDSSYASWMARREKTEEATSSAGASTGIE